MENELQTKLKEYRTQQSIDKSIPPHCIFHNKTIDLICSNPPQTIDDILNIKGFGNKKTNNYGQDILNICNGFDSLDYLDKPLEIINHIDEKKEHREIIELSPDINLSDEQLKVIESCDKGENIFMSGPGGTGKSYLIKIISERYPNKNIQVCALTGVAAELLDCNAKTINSWSGTKLIKGDPQLLIQNTIKRKKNISIWRNIDLLIVDEVSMMSLKFFDILDTIGKNIRKNEKPFGGIQLLFSGDFYQLPPVGDRGDIDSSKFCFESDNWNQTFSSSIELQKIYRQKDEKYMKILKQVRNGQISEKTFNTLNNRILNKENNLSYDKINKPIIISPKKDLVNYVNQVKMDKLNSEETRYEYGIIKTDELYSHSNYSNQSIDLELKNLEKNMTADKIVTIKIGASVMCIVNLDLISDKKIVNGSQGIVEDIIGGFPLVHFKNGVKKVIKYHSWMSEEIKGLGIKQLPLSLCWAITIHKSQGITLDSAIIDAGDNIFECGQIYVALSRIKSLDGLYLKEFDYQKIKTNPKVKKYYESLLK